MKRKVYECNEPSCTLGGRGVPGRFSGGATKEMITTITGDPEPENHGEGVCPNCGEKGKLIEGAEFEPADGHDPYARHHKAVAARVDDPDDKLTADDAQAALMELVPDAQVVGGDDDAD